MDLDCEQIDKMQEVDVAKLIVPELKLSVLFLVEEWKSTVLCGLSSVQCYNCGSQLPHPTYEGMYWLALLNRSVILDGYSSGYWQVGMDSKDE